MGFVLGKDKRGHSYLAGLLIAVCLVGCAGTSSATTRSVSPSGPPNSVAGTFTAYTPPTSGGSPEAIVMGPDGNIWFTELNRGRIGYVTPQGAVSDFAFPTTDATAAVYTLAVGPDTNVWFTNNSLGKVGYITTAGKIRQFPLSSPYARPIGIAAGPDGALWLTESAATKDDGIFPVIARITTDGKLLMEYKIPNPIGSSSTAPTSVPQMIVKGADGKMWFTDAGNNMLGSITTDGQGTITQYPLPTPNSRPFSIIAGKAGDLWFAEQNAVGHFIIRTHKLTEYPLQQANMGLRGLAMGKDGNLWCTLMGANSLAKMTPDGTFTLYPLTGDGQRPNQLISSADGFLWFTAPGTNSIDAYALPASA